MNGAIMLRGIVFLAVGLLAGCETAPPQRDLDVQRLERSLDQLANDRRFGQLATANWNVPVGRCRRCVSATPGDPMHSAKSTSPSEKSTRRGQRPRHGIWKTSASKQPRNTTNYWSAPLSVTRPTHVAKWNGSA